MRVAVYLFDVHVGVYLFDAHVGVHLFDVQVGVYLFNAGVKRWHLHPILILEQFRWIQFPMNVAIFLTAMQRESSFSVDEKIN